MYAVPENLGTNPHLRSCKHTGYGIVLGPRWARPMSFRSSATD